MRKRIMFNKLSLILMSLVAYLAVGGSAGNLHAGVVEDILSELRNSQGEDNPFSVSLAIKGDKNSFKIGENLSFVIASDRDCFVYLIDEGTTGTVKIIFPNKWHRSPKISSGDHVNLPKIGSKFSFKVKGDPGVEKVWLVAGSQRIEALEDLIDASASDGRTIAESPFLKMRNPRRVMKSVADELAGIDPSNWSIAPVEFEIEGK
ncbi:DUF4384 domain-containing protein [Thermodesulfobacteriota bacterium]